MNPFSDIAILNEAGFDGFWNALAVFASGFISYLAARWTQTKQIDAVKAEAAESRLFVLQQDLIRERKISRRKLLKAQSETMKMNYLLENIFTIISKGNDSNMPVEFPIEFPSFDFDSSQTIAMQEAMIEFGAPIVVPLQEYYLKNTLLLDFYMHFKKTGTLDDKGHVHYDLEQVREIYIFIKKKELKKQLLESREMEQEVLNQTTIIIQDEINSAVK